MTCAQFMQSKSSKTKSNKTAKSNKTTPAPPIKDPTGGVSKLPTHFNVLMIAHSISLYYYLIYSPSSFLASHIIYMYSRGGQ